VKYAPAYRGASRYGEPAEFGQAAAFVLSPAASYITGAMISVDGDAIRAGIDEFPGGQRGIRPFSRTAPSEPVVVPSVATAHARWFPAPRQYRAAR
jgi:hypothetical protein